MKKKVLSALLCAAMVVSMTACGLKAPETADTTTSQTTDAAAATWPEQAGCGVRSHTLRLP